MYTTTKRLPGGANRIGQTVVTSIVVLIIGVWLFPKIDPVTKLKKTFMSETSFYQSEGDASLAASEYRQAVVNYTKSIKADESNMEAWRGRAHAYYSLRMFNRCLSDISQAITLAPDDPALYFERSNVFFNDHKLEDALADLNRSLEIDPDYFDSLFARAVIHKEAGRLEESIMDFTAALDAASWRMEKEKLSNLYRYRGIVFLMNNEPEKAIADFHKTLDVWPESRAFLAVQLAGIRQYLSKPGKEVMKGELERLVARIEGSE